MTVTLSALCACRPLPPGRFLVLISVKRLSRPQGHSAAGKIRSIEKEHVIGTRTRDLPACSIVPQPTTLPPAPYISYVLCSYGMLHHVVWCLQLQDGTLKMETVFSCETLVPTWQTTRYGSSAMLKPRVWDMKVDLQDTGCESMGMGRMAQAC
jgi:hypothetical protein